ncbi:ATPase family AAA domain-containing protein 3 [Hondaea fermentalgiana]|uniref:ATPase family AAA domain-containing protein 3 n=1 Tax=Hondaea fermentalgiana TaxID=2315210 RepID=A0A2R5GVL5_9STRA|nr:ATPase family AAA domain-containing protein 3 [Hondaea fermentalgiana]|eukprot:GBG34886.1 ATPase family AAA domain-containing protein 3 [Hondaea fermentalgiana]
MWPFGKKAEDETPGTANPASAGEDAAKKAAAAVMGAASDAESAAGSIFKDEAKDEAAKPEPGAMRGFDPTALERAAKAARELQDLKFAPEAINIAKLKEERRGKQADAEAESMKARQKAFEVEQSRVQEQERRQTLQQDHKLKQEQAYYQDQLARKRHQDELNAQRAMKEQQLKREEEFQLRVEGMKRQTAEYEAKLRKDTERARVEAEMAGKADQERKNWDLHMQRSQMQAKEMRTTVLESVRESGRIIGDGVNGFLHDREKLGTTVGLFTMLAVGIYGARVGTGVLGRYVEARMGKPPLVRETSRRSPLETIRSPISSIRRLAGGSGNALDGVVVEPKLQDRLSTLAVTTRNTKNNGAPYRHAMLHGPPGTGKTLFAKKLAQASGMDYAILTGGDIAPLGREAVTEMHKLFDWANTSRRGVVVFIDEADAFLRKRTESNLSEDARNALNAFLYRTGTESKNFMVVYATNEPEQLDWAINDRTDELVPFTLPGPAERETMLKMYFDKLIVNNTKSASTGMFGGPKQITVDGVDDAQLTAIAQKLNGFSGREISKLVIGWQAAAYGTSDAVLNKALVDRVLDNSLEQHMTKMKWEGRD